MQAPISETHTGCMGRVIVVRDTFHEHCRLS
jgi:hypothetical protein